MHPGVAVIADDTWSALRGRAALTIDWAPGPQRTFDSDRFIEALPNAFEQRQFKVRHDGDAIAALGAASRRLEATYIYPFQAHAPLETMNCTAHVRDGEADIWVPTQTDVRTLEQAAKVTGLAPDRIHVHCALMGGGFGRRLFADFVAEAAELSQAVRAPVQLLWTRPDDMRHGYFQPATAERFTAGLDADGALQAIVHKTTASSLTIYEVHSGRNLWSGPPRAAKPDDVYERDESPWGAFDNPYAIPNLRVDCADVTSPVPTGPWRAVEYPSTVFGRESFLDELAHMLSRDPIALRLALLPRGVRRLGSHDVDRARLARVLEAVGDRSGWNAPLRSSERRMVGRGVAANVYHGRSYIAMVAEVSVARDLSDIRVDRIVTVVDCGVALNPLGVDGQTESGITWGLSATLLGKMDFRGGAPVQSSFADFHVMRMDRMPRLDTVILDSGAAPGGFGEHSVPTVAPAVANALFAATGKRLRALPLTAEKLLRA
ncbi:MAG TPA: molybdopterin cofactor-binding domain-containing protein [Gemmatimonadaceae bacterium]|nr:molybdopterin cofactor-binding domain-containing protein [Gemmatimonadaceae bacterium]